MFVNARAANEQVLDMTVQVAPGRVVRPAERHALQRAVRHPQARQRAGGACPPRLDNDWVGVQGDLVNQDTGEVTSFYEEISYYHGQDDDGSWSEGGQEQTEYLSPVRAGHVRAAHHGGLRPRGPRRWAGGEYRVALTHDTPRGSWFFFALVMLLVGPVLSFIRSSASSPRGGPTAT